MNPVEVVKIIDKTTSSFFSRQSFNSFFSSAKKQFKRFKLLCIRSIFVNISLDAFLLVDMINVAVY